MGFESCAPARTNEAKFYQAPLQKRSRAGTPALVVHDHFAKAASAMCSSTGENEILLAQRRSARQFDIVVPPTDLTEPTLVCGQKRAQTRHGSGGQAYLDYLYAPEGRNRARHFGAEQRYGNTRSSSRT